MDMTLEQYILNPLGKQNAILNASAREILKAQYTRKFDNILLRENGKIEYHLYKDSKANIYWAHIKVPSELVPNFYYDTVFKFRANQSIAGGGDLFKYFVNFYSNDPSFVYTFAYVFRKNNLFIEELRTKMSREALRESPKEKNPTESVGYVKSIYFAYLLMKQRGLNKISKFNGESKELNPKEFVGTIENADRKIELRQELGSKISKKKKVQVSNAVLKNMEKTVGKNFDKSNLQTTTTKKITAKTFSDKSRVKTTPTVKKK